jgi:HK97 gp10 family phage protein
MQVRIVIKMNKFPACPGAVAKGCQIAFQQLGPQLLSTMQGKTPVDTGALRGSETATVGDKQLTLHAGTDHAVYVEFGTRKMAAQPYMRPTVEGGAGQVASAMQSGISAALGGI